MSCESDDNSFYAFCSVLSTIYSIMCESFSDAVVIFGGDFNFAFPGHTLQTDELERFRLDMNLSVACSIQNFIPGVQR